MSASNGFHAGMCVPRCQITACRHSSVELHACKRFLTGEYMFWVTTSTPVLDELAGGSTMRHDACCIGAFTMQTALEIAVSDKILSLGASDYGLIVTH